MLTANRSVVSTCDSFEIKNNKGQTKLSVTDKGINFGNTDVTFTGK